MNIKRDDYSNSNLKGVSFVGQNLSGVNFRGADIRGADFTGANLKNSCFLGANAGVMPHVKKFKSIILVAFSASFVLCVSMLAGSIAAPTFLGIESIRAEGQDVRYFSLTCFGIVSALVAIFRFGMTTKALRVILRIGLITVLANLVLQFSFLWEIINGGSLYNNPRVNGIIATFLAVFGIPIFGAIGGFTAFLVYVISIVLCGVLISITFSSVDYPYDSKSEIPIFLFTSVSMILVVSALLLPFIQLILNGSIQSIDQQKAVQRLNIFVNLGSCFFALFFSFGYHLYRRSMSLDYRFSLVTSIQTYFASIGSTNFRRSNLENADFSFSKLSSAKFSGSNIDGVKWRQSIGLSFLNLSGSYLNNDSVRSLAVHASAPGQIFDSQNLCKIYAESSELSDASFIGADLSYGNFHSANLTGVKFVGTNLDGTDLSKSNLTGAFIERWGATRTTNLSDIRCDYVYMNLPDSDRLDPNRMPPEGRNFKKGEFVDFAKSLIATLDVYHTRDCDPRAVMIAIQKISERYEHENVRIVAIEKKPDGQVIVRVKASEDLNKDLVERTYYTEYERAFELLSKDSYNIPEKYISLSDDIEVIREIVQGDYFSEVSVNISVEKNYGVILTNNNNTFYAPVHNFATGDSVTQVANVSTHYPSQSLLEASKEIQQLLDSLSNSYPPIGSNEMLVTEALKDLEKKPQFKKRVLLALQSGGTEAIKELVQHPAINIFLATLEGWNSK